MERDLVLNDHRSEARDPAAPKRLYIFFHGHGGCGDDMRRQLTGSLQAEDPAAILRCPDGPCDRGWQSRSWCQVDEIDHVAPTPERMAARLRSGVARNIAYIEAVMAEERVSPSQVVIGGFSLGASAAYYAALGMDEPVAGVFSLSGGALDCIGAIHSKPPVMIAAGDRESHYYCGVPHTELAKAFLEAQGIATDRRILPNCGHDLTADTGRLLARFGKRVIPEQRSSYAQVQIPVSGFMGELAPANF